MIDILWGRENLNDEQKKRFVLDTRIYFSDYKKPEWFEDEFVKEFLKVIDNATVLFQEALLDYKGKGISTECISTGSKTLCDIYFDRGNHIFFGSAMGDNCLPFLARIATTRDVVILLEHYADFEPDVFKKKLIRYNGEILTQDTYDDSFSDWSASTQEEGWYEKFSNCGL